MRVKVFFEATPDGYFQLPFEWSAAPSKDKIGKFETVIPDGKFTVKGVLKRVQISENLGRVLFKTESSPAAVRDVVLPGGYKLRKVSSWLE